MKWKVRFAYNVPFLGLGHSFFFDVVEPGLELES